MHWAVTKKALLETGGGYQRAKPIYTTSLDLDLDSDSDSVGLDCTVWHMAIDILNLKLYLHFDIEFWESD